VHEAATSVVTLEMMVLVVVVLYVLLNLLKAPNGVVLAPLVKIWITPKFVEGS
jgi:hypothetical protein